MARKDIKEWSVYWQLRDLILTLTVGFWRGVRN